MLKYPKNCTSRTICTAARAIFPSKLNSIYWEFHELTGTDHGTDMVIEYVENEEFHNNKIQIQLKGTTNIQRYKKKSYYSFPLDIKTINYALESKIAFVLVIVDINSEEVYCIPLQDYFIANIKEYNKVFTTQDSISIRFTDENLLNNVEEELREISKECYSNKYNKIIKM